MMATILFSSACQRPTTSSQILKINFIDDPKTFDPRKGADPIASTVHFMLYEGLMRFLPDSSVEPAQAETVDISTDQKTYTFTLKKSTWSDGSAVTAYDFEDSWKKILSPDFFSPNAHLLYVIKNAKAVKKGDLPLDSLGIRALDAKTFQVELTSPTPYFLQLTAFCVLFPAKKGLDETYPNWTIPHSQHLVTNGPFLLSEYQPGQQIILSKNPDYWDAKDLKLQGIEISIARDPNTIMQMFEQKQLHIVGGPFSPLSQEQLISFRSKDEFYSRPVASSNVVFFNIERAPLNNAHIRRALGLAVDRQSIVDHITYLDQSIALEAVPFILKNKRTPFISDYASTKAQEEFALGLAELGINRSSFEGLTLTYFDSPQQQQIAQTLQSQWHHTLGIEIKIAKVDLGSFLDLLNRRDFDIGQYFYWAQYPDPMNILERFQYKASAKNYCNWENAQYVALLDKSFTDSSETRQMTLDAAEEILFEDMPFFALYHDRSAFLLQKNVKNFHQTVIGTILCKDIVIENP